MIWPNRTVKYDVQGSPAEVAERLTIRTQPKPTFRTLRTTQRQAKEQPFIGYVSITNFQLTRITLYRNSFKPTLQGSIEVTDIERTIVTVQMKIDIAVRVIMAAWFGIMGLFLFGTCLALLFGQASDIPIWIVLLFACLACGGMYLVRQAFYYECDKADKLFRQYLETD